MHEDEFTNELISSEMMGSIYRAVLGRDVDATGLKTGIQRLTALGLTAGVEHMVRALLSSREFKRRLVIDPTSWRATDDDRHPRFDQHNGELFRVPTDLAINASEPVKKAVLIGACFMVEWSKVLRAWLGYDPFDFILYNHLTALPPEPPSKISEYQFQIVSLQLRNIMLDRDYFRLAYSDEEGHRILFKESCEKIDSYLTQMMRWNVEKGLLTFITNFLQPQQSAVGRLLPQYDLRNPTYFVGRLNEHLENITRERYINAYVLDVNSIAATFGRKYIQDDIVCVSNHGSVLNHYDAKYDEARLERPRLMSLTYDMDVEIYIKAAWVEVLAAVKTLQGVDAVKMVIVDLDDTMWRGVLAESDDVSANAIEGWPVGFIEALSFLKKRGIILAICSKNEESIVQKIWMKVMGGKISLEDFTFVEINWNPKSGNVQRIIAAANILPTSVVFVDDNPVERQSVTQAVPGVRAIGADPYYLKRILMWSPELQVPYISEEAGRRSSMLQAQVIREKERANLSHTDFINTLEVVISSNWIESIEHRRFSRALELTNKTNQFNTTGVRWTVQELLAFFADGGRLLTFDVSDRFTNYGLVGVVFVKSNAVVQYVMSCRVLGLNVEAHIMNIIIHYLKDRGFTKLEANLVETHANYPCRSIYRDNGFVQEGEIWVAKFAD